MTTAVTLEQEQAKARAYLRARGTEAAAPDIARQVAAAFAAVEAAMAAVPAERAHRRALEGEWCVQEIVDHLVETHRPGLEELRCLLGGRRPPAPPIPPGLQSSAPLLRPWPGLLDEMRRVHGDIVRALEAVPADFTTDARAPVVLVVNHRNPDGSPAPPLQWVEDLDWKAYAIVWRLHAVDHLNQARKVLAALPAA